MSGPLEEQWTHKNLCICIVVCSLTLIGAPRFSHAALLVNESFSYGAADGSDLAGNNGGTGFSGAWSGGTRWNFATAGLSFGSLSVSGGATTGALGASSIPETTVTRPFTSTLSGTLYGAFLFRINSRTSAASTASLVLGGATNIDTQGTLTVNAPEFNSNNGRVRIENSSGGGLAGDPLAIGTIYLSLYKFDSAAKTATSWTLTSAQYANFIAGGLNEASLNGATLGTGATNVFERGSTSSVAALGAMTHLNLDIFSTLSVTFDEIRLSNSSLAEAAPAIPEASSVLTLGVVSAMTWMATVLSKRRTLGR